MIGRTISHYRVVDTLGKGGMGVVYKAEDTILDRTVAIKILAAHLVGGEEPRQRFLREARAAASLDHPNVCIVHEVEEADGDIFLVMGYVDGVEVSAKIRERPLKLEEALDIAIQAAEGLRAAHAKGIVHRDIKSSNLMLTSTGQVKIMDFGLAQLTGDTQLTRTGTVLGTPVYMSPEQVQGLATDRRTDIWSLGVVLYEMITGRLPFQGASTQTVFWSIVNKAPEPITAVRAGVPQEVDRIVGKALTKDPAARYQNADEMLADLRAVQNGLPQPAAEADPLSTLTMKRSRLTGLVRSSPGSITLWVSVCVLSALFALAVSLNVGGIRDRTLSRTSPRIASVAVLPLQNLSGDPEQEYFSDGLTEALVTALAKIRALKVTSRTSIMRYKGSKKTLRQIAHELGVDAVVEGSAQRVGDNVRITAQLIDADTDQHLWAESYDRRIADVLQLQAEVARAIAASVRVALRPEEEARLARTTRVKPATYEAYLKGMFWLNKGTPEAIGRGLVYFRQAVDHDPGDPLAHAGLALGYERVLHGPDPPPDALPRARDAMQTALRLDDKLAEVHAAAGIMQSFREWRWKEAERSFDRALEINPNMAFVHFYKAWIHAFAGRLEEATAELRRAQEGDPLTLDYTWGADFYRMLGRYDEAIAVARKALDVDANAPIGHAALAFTYSDQGKHEQALAEYKKAGDVAPPFRWYAAVGLAKAGRTAEVRKLLAELERQEVSPWTAYWRAALNALVDNKDEAFRWLKYEPHHDWVPYFRIGDEFRNLRGDPRFDQLLRRMNLPPL